VASFIDPLIAFVSAHAWLCLSQRYSSPPLLEAVPIAGLGDPGLDHYPGAEARWVTGRRPAARVGAGGRGSQVRLLGDGNGHSGSDIAPSAKS